MVWGFLRDPGSLEISTVRSRSSGRLARHIISHEASETRYITGGTAFRFQAFVRRFAELVAFTLFFDREVICTLRSSSTGSMWVEWDGYGTSPMSERLAEP